MKIKIKIVKHEVPEITSIKVQEVDRSPHLQRDY